MYRLGTDAGSLGPWWGKEEQTESVNIPLMIGTEVSHNSKSLFFKCNPISSVLTGGNRNMSSALAG